MKQLRCKYYNKRTTTRDNGNVQSYDQEESRGSSEEWRGQGLKTRLNLNLRLKLNLAMASWTIKNKET